MAGEPTPLLANRNMRRYLSLYFHFFRNCLMRDLEFRFNVLVWTLMDFVWFGLLLVSVELIFGQVQTIAGWSKGEVLILLCIDALFFDFLWTFVLDNLKYFSRLVRYGDLDFALLKPINLRFLVSTRYFESDHYLRILFLLYLIPKFLGDYHIYPTIWSWLMFGLLFALGIFIFYNLFFILTTTNFWFINLFNLQDLFNEIVDAGRFPVYVFKGGMRLFFICIIPIAFIATFPTQALLGRAGFEMVLMAILIGLAMFILSQKFWHFALRRYQSASS